MRVTISALVYKKEWVGRRYSIYTKQAVKYVDVPSYFAGEFEKLLSNVVSKVECSKNHILLNLGSDGILRSNPEPDDCIEISSVDEAVSFINTIK